MGPYAVFGNCSTKLKNEPLCLKISRFRVELKTGLVIKVNVYIPPRPYNDLQGLIQRFLTVN